LEAEAAVVIPVLDEALTLPGVLGAIPREWVAEVVVVDNGSRDGSAEVARAAGATVILEPHRGYGAACLAGIAALRGRPPRVLAFLDGDGSDDPRELPRVVAPILEGRADLVIGSRVQSGGRDALTPVQRFGNQLATGLLWIGFGARFTDLGPFRAIAWDALERLRMRDRDFGWTVEMQVKAARRGLRTREVPVRYRRRAGGSPSKISGTVRGTILAGTKILGTIAADYLRHGPPRRQP
jgi:glycosyltransferase involved in cell wall biosynthesis